MTQPSGYLLTANTEIERLRLQSRVFEPEALALLDAIGVRPGWTCLDVACGAMGVLGPLARRAGPTGRVVGADVEPKMLAAAQAYLDDEQLAAQGASPVELVQDDAYASRLPEASFDLTHVRFLFAPVGRDAELLPALRRLTRPGGVVAAAEPESSSWSVYPPSPAFDLLKAAILRAFREGGGDFDVGRRLHAMFMEGGLHDVHLRAGVVALAPGHPYLRVPLQFAASMRPRLLAAGIFTEAELDATTAAVEAHLARPDVIGLSFTIIQVWGRRPA
jgi:SAM-dependent methyltransferase